MNVLSWIELLLLHQNEWYANELTFNETITCELTAFFRGQRIFYVIYSRIKFPFICFGKRIERTLHTHSRSLNLKADHFLYCSNRLHLFTFLKRMCAKPMLFFSSKLKCKQKYKNTHRKKPEDSKVPIRFSSLFDMHQIRGQSFVHLPMICLLKRKIIIINKIYWAH